ncbi:MAG TPA: 30S ribosomal protein S17 [Blastocatellia bacterium]|jgi:small subunit ribosomal protein S17|nr:30S ribosomal protein S17 [Blastocatellia bacterium]
MEENIEETPNEGTAETVNAEVAGENGTPAPAAPGHRRQEKVGLVTSDKMQKTVVVRVERQVKHQKYKRYIRRRTKFMAHDELGAHIGDIVRIVETRPLSARKRWRVVEIMQKAR